MRTSEWRVAPGPRMKSSSTPPPTTLNMLSPPVLAPTASSPTIFIEKTLISLLIININITFFIFFCRRSWYNPTLDLPSYVNKSERATVCTAWIVSAGHECSTSTPQNTVVKTALINRNMRRVSAYFQHWDVYLLYIYYINKFSIFLYCSLFIL